MTGNSMEIKELDTKQVEEVYETYMRGDFPRDELKPLRAILEMRANGAYDCLGLFDGKQIVAYAYMVKELKQGDLLLDYLAACVPYRDQGYGSKMLAMLKTWYRGQNGIFLECECLRTSVDDAQLRLRRRRQDFYLRNGCIKTNVKALVYGVEYDIFYIPLGSKRAQYAARLDAVYRTMFSEKARKNHVRMWERHGIVRHVYRWDRQKDGYQEAKSLVDALGCRPEKIPQVVSLVGAGGKTTTMYQLADELAEMGKRVLVTTTTHIACPPHGQVLEAGHVRQVTADAWETPILTVGRPERAMQGVPAFPCGDRQDGGMTVNIDGAAQVRKKLAMPEGLDNPEELDRLLSFCDVVLIEADGAACHPFKVPQDKEPVILPQTGMVIACAGLGAAGQKWEDACFRYASQGAWLNRDGQERILPQDLAFVLSDGRGMEKNLPQEDCEYRIVLNQADFGEQVLLAAETARALPGQLQDCCVITAYDVD